MTSTHPKSESALLLAMANAQTTDEQRQIAAELETVRRAKRTQDEADRMSSLSLAALAFPDSDTERHTSTASSDWLADIEVPQVDRTEMENQMRAQATVWLQGRPAEVRADGEEFRTQAASKAHYLSNHFPGHREAAAEAFLDQIRTLAVEDWARADDDAVSVSDADQHEKVEFEGATADEEAETSASDSPSLAEGTEPEGDTPMDDSDPAWQGKNHDDSTFNREDAGQTVARRRVMSTSGVPASTCRTCGADIEQEKDGSWSHNVGNDEIDHEAKPVDGAWPESSRRDASRKTAASTHNLSVGDRVMLTQDGKEREFEVTSIAPPGSTGRAESAGPRVTVTLVGGQGYNVSFDDHSQPGISSWSKVSARMGSRKTAVDVNVIDLEVCSDCLMAAANGYDPHEWGRTADPEPWAEWDGYPGHPVAGDGEGHFSHHMCEGCGSRLAGDRYQAHWLEPKTASRKTAAAIPSLTDLTSMKSGDQVIVGGEGGMQFRVEYYSDQATGDNGNPVQGDYTGTFYVSRKRQNESVFGSEKAYRHGPTGTSGYGNPGAKRAAAEDVMATLVRNRQYMASRKTAAMPDIDQIMRYEQGDMDEDEVIALFQALVDTGLAWSLQGHYGRTARALIDAGLVTESKNASRKTAVSLSNVGVESDTVGTGTDPFGKKVRFSITPAEAKQLKDILYSDLAINFSGVDVEESDIIREGAGPRRQAALTPVSELAPGDVIDPWGDGPSRVMNMKPGEFHPGTDVTLRLNDGREITHPFDSTEKVKKVATRKKKESSRRKKVSNRRVAHNGWTNWDTWNAALWINNEEGIYRAALGAESPEALRALVEDFGLTGDGFDPDKVNWREVWTDSEFGPNHQGSRRTAADFSWAFDKEGGRAPFGRSPRRHHAVDQADQPCASCGRPVGWLEVFPNFGGEGILCIDCYSETPEGRRMPTSDELTRMWGGPVRQGSRKQATVGEPCPSCEGKGYYSTVSYDYDPYEGNRMEVTCSTCGGSGVVNEPTDYPLADDPIFTDRYSSRKVASRKVDTSRRTAGGGEAWQAAQEGGHASQVEFALSMLGVPEDQIDSATRDFLAQWDGSGDAGEQAQQWYDSRTASRKTAREAMVCETCGKEVEHADWDRCPHCGSSAGVEWETVASRRQAAAEGDRAIAAWAFSEAGVPDHLIDDLVDRFLAQWRGGQGIWPAAQAWVAGHVGSRRNHPSAGVDFSWAFANSKNSRKVQK